MDPMERQKRFMQIALSYLVSGLIALTACGANALEAPSPILLLFSEKYEISSATQEAITLGDVAEVVTLEPELRCALRDLKIIDSPEAGQSRLVSRALVTRTVRQAGLPFGRLQFDGPTRIEVLGPGQNISSDSILEQIKQDVLAEHGWAEDELSLEPVSIPDSIRLPLGEAEISLYRTSNHEYGTLRYNLTALVDKCQVAQYPAIVQVGRLRPVWVVKKKLEPGEMLSEDVLRVENRRMVSSRYDKMSIEDLSEIEGLKLRRGVNRGVIVTRDLFAKELMVSRGDKLEVFIHKSGIRLSVQGIAEGSGGPGDVIKVKNLQNGQRVEARILNSTSAELI